MNSLKLTMNRSSIVCAKLKIKQYPSIVPIIYDLSYYYNNINNQVIITIIGENFRYFSKVQLNKLSIEIIYISSSCIQISVPRNLMPGLYSLQVINDNLISNSINYTHLL
jgi:hypothetical protein